MRDHMSSYRPIEDFYFFSPTTGAQLMSPFVEQHADILIGPMQEVVTMTMTMDSFSLWELVKVFFAGPGPGQGGVDEAEKVRQRHPTVRHKWVIIISNQHDNW